MNGYNIILLVVVAMKCPKLRKTTGFCFGSHCYGNRTYILRLGTAKPLPRLSMHFFRTRSVKLHVLSVILRKISKNIYTIEGSKSRGGDITPNIFSLIHPLVQSRTWTLRRQRLARRKSPILTAQTTRPLLKKWPRGELWWVSIWHAFKIQLYDTLWCDCDTAAYDHSDPEEIGKK